MQIQKPNEMPFFAELPYYCWGSVNYNSEGDCQTPRDRNWSWLEVQRRDKPADGFTVRVHGDQLLIEGSCAERVASFFNNPDAAGLKRAMLVRELFQREEIDLFNHMLFFGSWKWIGVYASDMTAVGRWLMLDALRHSTEGAWLALQWAKHSLFTDQKRRLIQHVQQLCKQNSVSMSALAEPDPKCWTSALDSWFKALLVSKGISDPLLK